MSRLGPTLGMHGAVLASGTGLALHLGHRIGGDLEFFTQRAFRPSDIEEELRALAGVVETVATGTGHVSVVADGAHLSLTVDPTQFAEPTTRLNGCDVAGIIDIAATDLLEIGRDGTRCSFVDLYAVLQSIPFRTIARNAVRRYGVSAVEPLSIGKALVWFDRADAEPDPAYVGATVPWDSIKRYFESSLRQFVYDLRAETTPDVPTAS